MAPNARSSAGSPREAEADELVWKALSHGLRRRILDELRSGPLQTGDLAARLEPSRHVVMQHLNVLREADLVRTVTEGRTRVNYLNPVPIQGIHQRWVSHYEGAWAEALLGLKGRLEGSQDETTERGRDVG